jgi:transmembrane sensor
MKNDSGSSGRSEILLNEARGWAIRLRSGEVSQFDIDAFARWRAESPAHRRALAEANAQWEVLRLVARNIAAKQERAVAAPDFAFANRRLSRRTWLGGAMAASIGGAAYLVARPPLELWPSLSELAADYRTDIGERRQISFADKVSVEMNTRTSLAVTGKGTQTRQIELIAGEIAVATGLGATSPSEPFEVIAGSGRTSAAHATFDLRHDGQIVSVICLEGEVRVEYQNDTATLKTGQQIAYGRRGLSDIAATDGRVVEAWRRGLLVFDNQPLSQVIPEINRYRRGRIVLMNDDVGRLPLDATFRIDRIDEAVPKIAHLFALKARTLPGGVVLLS